MRPEGHRRLAVLIFEKTYRATLDALSDGFGCQAAEIWSFDDAQSRRAAESRKICIRDISRRPPRPGSLSEKGRRVVMPGPAAGPRGQTRPGYGNRAGACGRPRPEQSERTPVKRRSTPGSRRCPSPPGSRRRRHRCLPAGCRPPQSGGNSGSGFPGCGPDHPWRRRWRSW